MDIQAQVDATEGIHRELTIPRPDRQGDIFFSWHLVEENIPGKYSILFLKGNRRILKAPEIYKTVEYVDATEVMAIIEQELKF